MLAACDTEGMMSVVDIVSVVSLLISGVATFVSVLAWKAARRAAEAAERQARATERQADEARQSFLDTQAVALHEAQALPAMRITLEFDRLPVYLPARGLSSDGTSGLSLCLLGGDGRGVGCDVRYKHPRVPKSFSDLSRAATPPGLSEKDFGTLGCL